MFECTYFVEYLWKFRKCFKYKSDQTFQAEFMSRCLLLHSVNRSIFMSDLCGGWGGLLISAPKISLFGVRIVLSIDAIGLELMIAANSYNIVRKFSLFRSFRHTIPYNARLVNLISDSQTPPRCGLYGVLKCHSILIWSRQLFNNFPSFLKLLPLSEYITDGHPRIAAKFLKLSSNVYMILGIGHCKQLAIGFVY